MLHRLAGPEARSVLRQHGFADLARIFGEQVLPRKSQIGGEVFGMDAAIEADLAELVEGSLGEVGVTEPLVVLEPGLELELQPAAARSATARAAIPA